MDTICGLDAEECHYQQDYVSSLVQTVKNNINRVSYIECDTDPEVELALTESKYNNVPENPPNDDALLEIFQMIKDSDTCEEEDLTYVRYEVCTAPVLPYNACKTMTDQSDATCSAGLFIQIPCLCEICLPEVTYHMEPAGKSTIAFQGWIWMEGVEVAQCKDFNVVLHGFADMNQGIYKIFGMDGRYQIGMIETPNPCYYYTTNPFTSHDSSSSSSSSSSSDDSSTNNSYDDDGCNSRGLGFVEDTCDFLCNYNGSEFSGTFLNAQYDANVGLGEGSGVGASVGAGVGELDGSSQISSVNSSA